MEWQEEFKKIRKEQGISQRKLAEIAGCQQADLARMESGKVVNPGIKTVDRLLNAMGYELSIKPVEK